MPVVLAWALRTSYKGFLRVSLGYCSGKHRNDTGKTRTKDRENPKKSITTSFTPVVYHRTAMMEKGPRRVYFRHDLITFFHHFRVNLKSYNLLATKIPEFTVFSCFVVFFGTDSGACLFPLLILLLLIRRESV